MAISSRNPLFQVRLHEPTLVRPLAGAAESRPAEATNYFLTNLDQTMAPLIPEILYVFEADVNARCTNFDRAAVMKEALQKVLVHFYPLAGRLGRCPQGNLILHCNGQGLLFVTADADIQLSELGDLDKPNLSASLRRFVYPLDGAAAEPPLLLTFQVTQFKCGGLVLGLASQHCTLDVRALVEFVNSWAEIARGAARLSVPPVLDRSLLKARTPLQIRHPHYEFLRIQDLSSQKLSLSFDQRCFFFTFRSLEKLKKGALDDTSVLSKCSVFEVLSAFVWRCRTKALGMKAEQMVKLLLATDGRPKLQPALPTGYMGNGALFTCALASARELEERPLSHVVKLVQDAIAGVTDEYVRSQIDYVELHKPGLPLTEASLMVIASYRLPFYEADFGWGAPKYAGPVGLPAKEAAILFAGRGKRSNGINMVIGLPDEAMTKFADLLHPLTLSPASLL